MTRSLTRRQAAVLGLAVVAGLALAAAGLALVAGRQRPWAGSFDAAVTFADVKGVGPGTPVRLFGHPAGEVVAAELPRPGDPARAVTLRLRLSADVRPLLCADAGARIRGEGLIGTRVVELEPGTAGAFDPAVPLAGLASPDLDELLQVTSATMARAGQLASEASAALAEAKRLVAEVRAGKGTLGKLARDESAYDDLLAVLREGQEALSAVRRDAEAARKVPFLGGYVPPSATELLVRPNCDRQRRVFAEGDLFEPGRATLTDAGREKLDEAAAWLNAEKNGYSEVVVAAFAPPGGPDGESVAAKVTQTQADEAAAYLQNKHGVHRLGWWGRRKVTGLGLGRTGPPQAEGEKLPAARVEVLLFVPRSR